MSNKKIPIKYTSRDFESIRRDLENFAKRYYADTYRDFNRASFGSLMLDTVSYVGDILSFYLDYQVNESFLDSAVEYGNVVRLARQLGYRLQTSPASYGMLTFYIEIPAAASGLGPNNLLVPTLRAGSTFSSLGGGFYTLLDDVDFSKEGNQIVVGTADSTTGNPLTYVIRATARAVSGRETTQTFAVGDFARFRRVQLRVPNISNILRVIDSAGNEYYEVDNLSQDTIYKPIQNTTATRSTVPNILKPVPVPRRFVVETTNGGTSIQFGYGSDTNTLTNPVVDPAETILDLTGRDYITEIDIDPTKLISTDKFGIGPANTTLRVDYRFNTTSDVNAAADTITKKESLDFKFNSQGSLVPADREGVIASLEVTNEEPFVGSVSLPSSDEVKQRAFSYFATQNRAVTAQDYQALCYAMPAKFGMIKRVAVARDADEFKQNINIYVMSENSIGKLIQANNSMKINLKNWLSQYKMITDTVDILDAHIVNFAVKYEVAIGISANKYDVINACDAALKEHFSQKQDIGEPIKLSGIYLALSKVNGVIDTTAVEVVLRSGGVYSSTSYDLEASLSTDGTSILAEKNVVFELKYPSLDIKGSTK